MKKVSLIEWLVVFALIFVVSCTKDQNETEVSLPSHFSVSVNDVTISSALLTWESAETSTTGTVTYSIKVGDSMYESGLTTLEYLLDSLTHTTPYEVTIVASNTQGESTTTVNFTTQTPENLVFLLESFENNAVYPHLSAFLEYDEQMRLISFEGDDLFDIVWHKEYDVNENLLNEYIYSIYGKGNGTLYFYTENQLDSIISTFYETMGFSRFVYTFQDVTNYEELLYKTDNGLDTISKNRYSLELDNNNQVTHIEKIDLFNNITQEASLEYEGGNLTKVINYEGDVYEITYDDKKNFQTYTGSYSYYTYMSCNSNEIQCSISKLLSGFNFMTFISSEEFGRIPFLNKLRTTNNPIEYKKNGVVYRTNQFTYNVFGYPTQMITETDTITFTYKEIY